MTLCEGDAQRWCSAPEHSHNEPAMSIHTNQAVARGHVNGRGRPSRSWHHSGHEPEPAGGHCVGRVEGNVAST